MRKGLRGLYLSLLVAVLILTASASERAGSLWIRLNVGELPVINGAFTLYRVGAPISDGYRIGEEFGGGFVRREDALSPHLAQWLNSTQEKQGTRALLDVDGNAVFSDHGGLRGRTAGDGRQYPSYDRQQGTVCLRGDGRPSGPPDRESPAGSGEHRALRLSSRG